MEVQQKVRLELEERGGEMGKGAQELPSHRVVASHPISTLVASATLLLLLATTAHCKASMSGSDHTGANEITCVFITCDCVIHKFTHVVHEIDLNDEE